MVRVLVNKTTGMVGEMQSNATEGTLLGNISNAGENPNDYEEKLISERDYQILVNTDPTRVMEREVKEEAEAIKNKASEIQQDRERKEAVRLLKIGGRVFKHFDNNGNRA